MSSTDEAGWWLRIAVGDLEAARSILRTEHVVPARLGAQLAQQAAEKALKAILVASGVPATRTHDLVYLAARGGTRLRSDLAGVDLVMLSAVLSRARYPNRSDPQITTEAAVAWLADADRVVAVAAQHIGVVLADVSAA